MGPLRDRPLWAFERLNDQSFYYTESKNRTLAIAK